MRNYYQTGLTRTVGEGFVDYHVGALVATPGYIKDQAVLLDADIMAADREIANQAGLPGFGGPADAHLQQWWRDNWSPFVTSWSDFRNGHEDWSDNMWGSSWDTIQQYRAKLIDMRRAAAKVGFSFESPMPAAPDTSIYQDVSNALTGLGGLVKTVVYAAIVMIGGILVYKFYLASKMIGHPT